MTPIKTTKAARAAKPELSGNRRNSKRGLPKAEASPGGDSGLDPPSHRVNGGGKAASHYQAVIDEYKPTEARYLLRLYVAGVTARSSMAISNLKSICEEHLKGRYQLDVVDIYQQPALASRAQITAVPTLIRSLPLPLRRIVGDMSRKDRVLVGLDMLEQV